MSSIAEWLASLGMAQYTERFTEDDIDFDVLGELTDQDFDRLGVSVGHRRRMLKAIREHGGPVLVTPQVATPAPVAPRVSAERRQLTVMFCDLVGSTELSGKLDPEDLRGIIGRYHRSCTDCIERNGGFVAKYMGDGVLAYFGYPQAHEHDAERAIRAGLALVEAIPKLETAITGTSLQVRVGIATGLVVVGDLIGSGEAQERGIVGDTPNLAARLQGIAKPNTVVIAEGTRRLVGNLFELQDLRAEDLKGIRGPARAWTALRASSVESRFEALHASGLTTLVGREEESELLLRRWAKVKAGEGQVVLISGEAGIGKSRLTAALLERLTSEPHTRLRYFCSPQHTDSALYPIIGQISRAATLAHDDTPQAKLDKLDTALAQTATTIEDAALCAEMLSLSNDGRYPALDLTPEQRRQRTLEALTTQLAGLASQQPILMIFEDVHWIDPTSLEALGRTVDRIKALPVLLIVTFRPEFNAPWLGRSHVTSVTLNRLEERETAAIIAQLVGKEGLLPADVIAEIVERTDGIPLFVEEMTKAVLEAESEGEGRRSVAAVRPPTLAVPASLHASLMARLDRLGRAKELAQTGAAIGREFSHALLAAVVDKPEEELRSGLDRLIHAGLLFQQGVPPRATYLFKHALVQDAAYGTLLRETRKDLHSRIGTKLEEIFPDVVEAQPDILAHHFAEGALSQKAISYWAKAGKQAVSRAMMSEGLSYLNKGLTLLLSMPDNAWRRENELTLQIAIGSALIATSGPAARSVGEAYERAEQLWENLGRPSHFEPKLALFWHQFARGELETATETAKELIQIGATRNDTAVKFIGRLYLADVCLDRGDFVEARGHAEHSLALFEPSSVSRRFLPNGQVSALVSLSLSQFWLGYLDQARLTMDQALLEARRLAHPFTLVAALLGALRIEWVLGSTQKLLDHAEELIALGFDTVGQAPMFRDWCISVSREGSEGAATLKKTWISYRATDALRCAPLFLMLLANALEKAGHHADALEQLAEALRLVAKTEERWCEAELHRVKGELQKLEQEYELAEACFRQALAVARRQSAKTWELRAAISLASLWRDQGKWIDASDLLERVYGWFREGFDMPNLQEAKALLDELNLHAGKAINEPRLKPKRGT